MSALRFVEWDPYFSAYDEETRDVDEYGMVWIHDAEGERLVKVDPELVEVVAVALEYTHAAVQDLYGDGWGNLSNREVANLLRAALGRLPK